jgi:flagellar biosynthesis GTPase FlhF
MNKNAERMHLAMKSKTPEELALISKKKAETRAKNKAANQKQKAEEWKLRKNMEMILNQKIKIKTSEGSAWITKAELIAHRLVEEASSPLSKNVVPAVKEIRSIMGDTGVEKIDVNATGQVMIVFSNDAQKFSK